MKTIRHKLRLLIVWLVLLSLFPAVLPAQQLAAAELSLIEALSEALQANPHIGVAAMDVRQAEAAVREARSSLLPDLVVLGDYTHSEEPALVNPMHGSPTAADPLEFDRDIYSGVLRLDVPLLDLASIAGVKTARRMVDVGRAQSGVVKQGVLAGVVELYVQMGQISDNITLIDAHIAVLERRHKELVTLAREGRVPQASVAELSASLASTMSDRLELLHRTEVVAYNLGELLGRSAPVYPRVHNFTVAGIDKESFATGKIATGPQGLAAEARYAAARETQKAALLSFAPRLSGFAAESLRAAPDTDVSTEWSVGLALNIPIVTGGERVARVQSADARLNAAQYELDSTMTNERNEAQIARTRSQNAALRRDYLADAVGNQAVSVTAMDNGYKEGRASLSDLLEEETVLLELKMRERSMLYEELLAYVAYYTVTGELSPSLVQIFIEE